MVTATTRTIITIHGKFKIIPLTLILESLDKLRRLKSLKLSRVIARLILSQLILSLLGHGELIHRLTSNLLFSLLGQERAVVGHAQFYILVVIKIGRSLKVIRPQTLHSQVVSILLPANPNHSSS